MEEKEKKEEFQEKVEEFQEKVEQAAKGFLKVKKAFLIGVTTVLILAGIFFGGLSAYANYDLRDYSNNKQITEIANALDCDTSYIVQENNLFARMQHNDGEPIYVCFDDVLSEKEIENATAALDYMFGIVGQINDKYHYQIVDKETYDANSKKTRIYFSIGKLTYQNENIVTETEADIERKYNWFSYLTAKRTMNDFAIHINREKVEEKDLFRTYLHELKHAFCSNDIYFIDGENGVYKYQGNTVINPKIADDVALLTPNDFKCIISVYAQKYSKSDKAEVIAYYQQLAEDYEQRYYDHLSQYCKDQYGNGVDMPEGDFVFQKSFTYYGYDADEKSNNLQIVVQGDCYTFNIFDAQGQLVDSCSGEAVFQNGVAVLKDVRLKEGLHHGMKELGLTFNGYVQDFAIVKTATGAGLVDMRSNSVYYGRSSLVENQISNDKSDYRSL